MCLAVPARVVTTEVERAVVDLHGNRFHVNTALTPDAAPGDWVLVHAGFAITVVTEEEALATWDYLRDADPEQVLADAGHERGEALEA